MTTEEFYRYWFKKMRPELIKRSEQYFLKREGVKPPVKR